MPGARHLTLRQAGACAAYPISAESVSRATVGSRMLNEVLSRW